jgi:hypothetical protein
VRGKIDRRTAFQTLDGRRAVEMEREIDRRDFQSDTDRERRRREVAFLEKQRLDRLAGRRRRSIRAVVREQK